MIARYDRPEISELWSDEFKYSRYLDVELAILGALEGDKVPAGLAEQIRKMAKIKPQRVDEIEKVTRHDVIAFCTSITEQLPTEMGKFFHFGVTSSDIIDSALTLQVKASLDVVIPALKQLCEALKQRALETKEVLAMGRSHGMYAEPLSFGQKLLGHHNEFRRRLTDYERFYAEELTIQFSGAVGNYTILTPEHEGRAAKTLGLVVEPLSTQVIPRDRLAKLISLGALTGAAIERLCVEIRHLHRSEVFELHEGFAKGQKGSSTMPHKKNPISGENLTGMARMLKSHVSVALENVALWHERDISHSSVERVIGPDACIVLDFMLARMHSVMKNLDVFPENMMKNLELTRGLYASQSVLLALIDHGMTRETAYRVVQSCALEAWNEGKDFRTLLAASSEVKDLLTPKQVDALFDLEKHFRHVDTIFERVFK
ncbi:MAG: adenylosuccinate lyase [Deltaproteobacteria bacterium CG_4_10_14_0_2_um_filter_43_8]|nr:MAG: adenylosuccinate lyase [Deltaproteobacteria bacterium CG_4_10_14_0_2_um_filter_43_8]